VTISHFYFHHNRGRPLYNPKKLLFICNKCKCIEGAQLNHSALVLTVTADLQDIFAIRGEMALASLKTNQYHLTEYKPGNERTVFWIVAPHALFLSRLLTLRPEDGGDMFLRNVGGLPQNNTSLQPKRSNRSQSPLLRTSNPPSYKIYSQHKNSDA
jgi:hypothetical protein